MLVEWHKIPESSTHNALSFRKNKLTERHVFEMELFELLKVKVFDVATSKLQADVAAIQSQILISIRNHINVK